MVITTVLAASLAAFLAAADPITHFQGQPVSGTWRIRLQDNGWTRADGERWVSIQMRRDDDRGFGVSIPRRDLEGAGLEGTAWTASGVRFTLKRDAGTIVFRGDFDNGRGAGDFTFTPDAGFVAAMQARDRSLTSDDVLRLAIHDVSRAYIQAVEAQGYEKLPLDDLVKMRIHGVDADYIAAFRKAGFDKLSVDDLVKTRIHGVSPAFIREVRELGFKDVRLAELIRMRIHGVSTAFVKELRALGYTDVDVDDLVKMRIHGVTPEFIRELKEVGYGSVRQEALVRFRIHGVTAEFIREVQQAGFKNMTPDELVEFSIHGRRWLSRR
jgi:hypothetical protein